MSRRSQYAVQFAAATAVLLTIAGTVGWILYKLFPSAVGRTSTQFPRAFAISTILLLVGSIALIRAVWFVRRERQRPFRQQLFLALAAGTLFVGTQSFALNCLIHQQTPQHAQIGAGAFVAVIAALHAMHFIVALMFLVYVTINALGDRYDHEYYWGVTLCGWFWHALGIIWCMVLVVMLIASVHGDG